MKKDYNRHNLLRIEEVPFLVVFVLSPPPHYPTPVTLTESEIINIDFTNGMIRVVFIDADDNTPVLDIKPYTPSFDRVETPGVPAWCSEWPKSTEVSGCFDWGQVFNF